MITSPEYIKSILRLDPDTGKLYWLATSKFHPQRLGKEAGSLRGKQLRPRVYVKINNRAVPRARIVFAIYYGRWPMPIVDHINRNTLDDRPINLREASIELNNHNHSRRSIRLLPSGNYQARLGQKSIGVYPTKIEAAASYESKRKLAWGT